tara:strand:- start:222 stop:1001 length:780 start_codon:yes stop_codon:yes gene_type:complete
VNQLRTLWSYIKSCQKTTLFQFIFLGVLLVPSLAVAQQGPGVNLQDIFDPEGFSTSINLLIAMALLTLAPFLLISVTCFLRVVIVLSMTRQALQTQQAPPNSVLVTLALFTTIFVMTPTYHKVYETAILPYQDNQITQTVAFDLAMKPLREFMFKFVQEKDLGLFLEFSKVKHTSAKEDVPLHVLIPAFVISELKAAFQIGFLLFIPFIVIDLVISNVLLSLGMFMLSPAMVSLPFKILLFVLTDGWNLIIRGLLISFQ